MVIVGVSAGGLEALCVVLGELPATLGLALVVVQHRSRDSNAPCEVLQGCTDLTVEEVVDKATVQRAHVYLAPPDYHLLVEPGFFSLSLDAPQLYSRPSIDVAFQTAADAYGPRLVGIVLTGANHDGAAGLRYIADRGGAAIVQDPATAEVPVMPRAAIAAVPEAKVLPLAGIAGHIRSLSAPTRAAPEDR
jgi:two-component system, chemotaxis family, protein-glutamate methylesterase/glutaminase